jgi:hypothetical protein
VFAIAWSGVTPSSIQHNFGQVTLQLVAVFVTGYLAFSGFSDMRAACRKLYQPEGYDKSVAKQLRRLGADPMGLGKHDSKCAVGR